ncbi:MAG: Bax inhibitor-1/YccA family protein, partial [Plesiomonas sp.]
MNPRSNNVFAERTGTRVQAYLSQVYGWMTCGLLLTAFVAWYAAST